MPLPADSDAKTEALEALTALWVFGKRCIKGSAKSRGYGGYGYRDQS